MMSVRLFVVAAASFVLGTLVQSGLAQNSRNTFTFDGNSERRMVATTLLDGALQLAGQGSWEHIAVGRAWYLGGDKARGQQIIDGVTSRRNVESSDWFRVGRVYVEAGEWEKAQQAFDRALAMKKGDDSGMVEYGAYANINGDRAKAEKLFAQAFEKNGREFWHWVNAGGSYLGVRPSE